jgi:hypothetical protein
MDSVNGVCGTGQLWNSGPTSVMATAAMHRLQPSDRTAAGNVTSSATSHPGGLSRRNEASPMEIEVR